MIANGKKSIGVLLHGSTIQVQRLISYSLQDALAVPPRCPEVIEACTHPFIELVVKNLSMPACIYRHSTFLGVYCPINHREALTFHLPGLD